MELVRYTYEHTRPDASDKLRAVVSMYAACLIKLFYGDAGVNEMLETVPDFKDEVATMLDVV